MTQVDPRIGSEIAGYRIETLLGRCGLGVVYLAGDVCVNRRVALRLLSPELTADVPFRGRFLRESQVAASLDHPNIVPVYEAGEAAGCLYVATGYVDAVDLGSLLAREGRLAPERALSIVAQLADALDAARWSRGLVHGSLTPSEVLVAARADAASGQHVSLLGFGLRQELPPGATLAQASRRLGTVDCLAPEQIEGKPVSPRTDVYALGCVLFECLTGRPPFKRDSDDAVLDARRYEPPPSVTRCCPGLPAEIDRVIGKAMAKWPDERYSACGELATAAQAALSHGWEQPVPASRDERVSEVVPVPAPAEATDGGAVVEPDPSASRSGTRGWRTIAAIGVVVLLAALAAGAAWLTGRDSGDRRSATSSPTGAGATGEIAVAGGQTTNGTQAETANDDSLARIVSLGPGRLVRIDAETGEILARVAIPPPGPVATDGGSIWVLSGLDTTNRAFLVHVVAATNRVTEIFDATPIIGRSGPSTLAAAGGSAWVSSYESGQVYRFYPRAIVARRVELSADSPGFAWPVAAAGSLWGSGPSGLLRVDPVTERVLARIDGVGPVAAAGEGFLWAYVSEPHRIVRVDTQTLAAVPVRTPKRLWSDLTVADGAVWATSPTGGVIVRLDPVTGEEQGRIRVWRVPGALAAEVVSPPIAAGAGAVWAANQLDGTVVRYDIATGQTETIDVGGIPKDLVFARGSVWVATGPVGRTEWVAHAGAVCKAANGQFEAAVAEIDQPYGPDGWKLEELAAWSKAAVRFSNEALATLRALPRPGPPPDRAWVRDALALFEQQTDAVRRVAAAAAAGEASRAKNLEQKRVDVTHRKDGRVGSQLWPCPVSLPA